MPGGGGVYLKLDLVDPAFFEPGVYSGPGVYKNGVFLIIFSSLKYFKFAKITAKYTTIYLKQE